VGDSDLKKQVWLVKACGHVSIALFPFCLVENSRGTDISAWCRSIAANVPISASPRSVNEAKTRPRQRPRPLPNVSLTAARHERPDRQP
jgi:hypothetical protein